MQSSKIRFIAMILGALCFFAIPGIAMAGTPTDTDDPTQTTPATPPDDNGPGDEQGDPSLEPPSVLDDPAPNSEQAPLAPPTENPLTRPSDENAPPTQDLTRFSDDVRAPEWQQRPNWLPRGLFYQRSFGWYRFQRGLWWQWRNRWVPCAQPRTWQPPVVRPVPLTDPSPNSHNTSPVTDAVNQIAPPRVQNTFPNQQDRRARALRRALFVCQARYVFTVRVLRQLRVSGRITFRQYIRGIHRALDRRQDCRRLVFRAFSRNRPIQGPFQN